MPRHGDGRKLSAIADNRARKCEVSECAFCGTVNSNLLAGTNRPCVRNRERSLVTRAESDMTCAVRMSLIHKIILHEKNCQRLLDSNIEPAANDLTYTGKDQTLVTAGKTEDGKVLYALGTDTEPSEDAYSEELPTGKEAGTYTVWYKVVADSNHNDKAPVSIAVTIAAKKASSEDISVTADKSSFTFDGEAKAPVVTVKDGDKELVQGTDYDIEYAGAGNNVYVQSKDAPVEIGTYKAVIIFKGNYEGIKEIEFEIAAPIVYTNTEGAGGTWTKGSSEALSFTFKRSAEDETTLSHFTGILVDGQKVTDFTAKSGSVIVKLNAAFLETLAIGEHTLTAQFDDGEDVEIKFTVKEKPAEEKPADKTDTDTTAPATGDVNRPQMLFILMLISMAGMIILGSLRRKNEGGKNRR